MQLKKLQRISFQIMNNHYYIKSQHFQWIWCPLNIKNQIFNVAKCQYAYINDIVW